MPYKTLIDKTLPSYVNKLSDALKLKWVTIYNAAYEKYGEDKAMIIANTWLKQNIKKQETVAKTENKVSLIRFTIDDSKELIKKTEDGDDYVDFVLTDTLPDSQGDSYPLSLLEKWQKQINSGDMIIGDTDHLEYDKLLEQGYSLDEIMNRLKEKKGIAKTLKAIIDKGKLWVRAIIDKRYKKLIKEKAKGVSLEALVTRNSEGDIIDGELGGFTFGVNCNPVNQRAVIV
jgi:hypothetical protein